MLFKYHFEIEHINRKDNKRVDIFSKKAEL